MSNTIDELDELVSLGAKTGQQLGTKASWIDHAGSGVLGLTMPTLFAGQGKDLRSQIALFEGLAYGGADAGILFALGAQLWSVQYPIVKFGTDAQRYALLPGMISGELRGAHAATEPETGSDIFALNATAVRCPGGYRLNGTKRFITNAPVADVALVLASTSPQHGVWGLTAFLVKLNQSGVARSGNVKTVGLQSAELGELYFDNCFVADDSRLGSEGGGAAVFNYSLDFERSFILAPALGLMRRQLEESVSAANKRQQRGRPISSFQSVSNRIADMAIRLELSRVAIYSAATLKEQNKSTKNYSAIVKLSVSEAYLASGLDAFRNLGASSYLLGSRTEIDLRDALGSIFYSGTSDILRNIIAHNIGTISG